MRTKFFILGLAVAIGFGPQISRAANPSGGLWVGDVTLNAVNESVVGINAANQVVAPDPSVTTPVNAPAHIRIIFHVDGQGQVRLLKSVAVLAKDTNQPPHLALITDSSLYPNFTGFSNVGRRIASAAFDFGEPNTVAILNQVAAAAGNAAAAGQNALNAANKVVQGANIDAPYNAFVTGAGFNSAALNAAASATAGALQSHSTNANSQQLLAAALSAATNNFIVVTNRAYAQTLQTNVLFVDTRYVAAVDSVAQAAASGAANAVIAGGTNTATVGSAATNAALAAVTAAINAPSPVSPGYKSFIATPAFLSSAGIAANAATAAATTDLHAGVLPAQVQNDANAAALKALTDAGDFAAADAVVVNQVNMNGTFAAGGSLSGSIYLGASHPTNPFRHRMHPDHTIGYAITRALTIQFDAASGTNVFQSAGFGVDQLTGTYREEISGLHKPLGTSQNIGLITEGVVSLNRVSQVDTLNQ